MNTRIAMAAAAALCIVATAATGNTANKKFQAGPTCAQATAALQKAQAVLSTATRNVDSRSVAYHMCMKRSRNNVRSCHAKARALRAARTKQKLARDAYRYRKASQQSACRPR